VKKLISLLIIIFFLWTVYFHHFTHTDHYQNFNQKKIVVLVHGLSRTRYSMKSIEKAINQKGISTYSLGYPSNFESIDKTTSNKIVDLNAILRNYEEVIFVAHSLGNMLSAKLISKLENKDKIKHFFALAPPFGENYMAKWSHGNFLGKMIGENLVYLKNIKKDLDIVFLKENKKFKLHVIAGIKKYPILSDWIEGDDDGIVSIEETKLYSDVHQIIPSGHTWIMNDAAVEEAILKVVIQ